MTSIVVRRARRGDLDALARIQVEASMAGYSGIFPPSYLARQRVLARPLLDPSASAQAIGGATHVVVHRGAWTDDTGARVAAWLEQFGATLIAEGDGAALYELPVRENFAQK